MPIDRWMTQHPAVYPNLGILLSNKYEGTTDTWNNVDKSQNNSEWKKTLHPKNPFKQCKLIYSNRKQSSFLSKGDSREEEKEGWQKNTKKLSRERNIFVVVMILCVCVYVLCVCKRILYN